jgi:eukaryotic-like serine/threonine-protein kinase
MAAERWARIQMLFETAVQLDAVERRRFLTRECAGDDALRVEVEQLLRADRGSADASIGSAIASAAREFIQPPQRLGQRLDEYLLVRELGRGGMGAVWLGERADGEYTARVAIKVVSGIFSPDIERRFRVERQILADLAHPNIARLIDGGTAPDGMPYLVMEYVDGDPITTWADEKHLDLNQRLRLFRTVCDAVRSAHAALIVHRDIKPANILVRADGTPKLVDFGIAKILEDRAGAKQKTITMVRLLTPSYASPEQLRGEAITVAADLWALGVLLYELLTGTHPFALERTAPLELRRRILEDDPEPPSLRAHRLPDRSPVAARALRGDLDAIVLRALQKAPASRYVSAAEFSNEVRRFMIGEPIHARIGELGYLARRFVRRHAAVIAVTGTLLATTLGIATFNAVRLVGERNTAQARALDAAHLSQFLADLLAATGAAGSPDALHAAAENAVTTADSLFASSATAHAEALTAIGRLLRAAGDTPSADEMDRRSTELRGPPR